jgi:hypothetical protein
MLTKKKIKIMTPKEKAIELYNKFKNKKQAHFCVDELINDSDASNPYEVDRLTYWVAVKEWLFLI